MEKKTKFYRIPEESIKVIEDALRIYLAIETKEYHEHPSLALAKRIDLITETLDMFI
jgi:hypothetical protein